MPLLATLLTLLVADHTMDTLPTSRAHLLADAVEASIKRWELANGGLSDGSWSPQLSAGILIDGYRQIGRLLNTTGAEQVSAVEANVVDMLMSRWQLSPGASTEVAADVLRFWDDRMGVFVARGGRLEPRSRIFAEIGDAMWAAVQDPATINTWVGQAAGEAERRETVLLAAGLSTTLLSTLIDVATSDSHPAAEHGGALLWAAQAITAGQHVDDQRLTAVIDALATVGRRPLPPEPQARRRGFPASFQRDNVRWTYARALVSLRVPTASRAHRDNELATLHLEVDQQVIAHALAALSDARFDEAAALPAASQSATSAMLELPVPERQDLACCFHVR